MSDLQIRQGSTVRFVLESEALLGSHLPVLVTGRVDGEIIEACSRTRLVPVRFETIGGDEIVVYVADAAIVTSTNHPSLGSS